MTGDARAADREPRRGRHRRGAGAGGWTPVVARAVDVGPRAEPVGIPTPRQPRRGREPVVYAWHETPATGLRKFNLGTIPASVTPPRTWRKAAWFAVCAATFVVCGLGFAAFALVGKPRNATTIDALPGQPTQQLLITDLPGEVVEAVPPSTAPTTTTRPATPSSTSATRPPRTRNAAGRPIVPGTAPTAGQPGAPSGPVRPPRPAPGPTTTAPPRNTLAAAPAVTDPDTLGDRTEQYFAQVIANPAAASQLTAGKMRAEGPEGIEARYANVKRVEVKRITIDPTWSLTRSTLVLVHRDGTTTVVQRELTFTSGADPKITGDAAV